ncbi:MAG TPA: sigma-70 family RNA polymerase sigma factor [Gemmatimonadaceae bacterium]|nr:sigma-70 family RNA polymerase sigma factor [Gemmatimonadaceae bacterium]
MTRARGSFDDDFVAVFNAHFRALFRYLNRVSGDPELATDIAQEAFVRLYRRGALPSSPEAWLATVAMNLLRNARSTQSRRRRLLTVTRAESSLGDAAPSPAHGVEADETRARVRAAIDGLSERERQLLLLSAEGHSYRDMAALLALHEASVGTLLARARQAFRDAYTRESDASR